MKENDTVNLKKFTERQNRLPMLNLMRSIQERLLNVGNLLKTLIHQLLVLLSQFIL